VRGPVACLDIDYFFAQAEELRDPSLKSRPVVVCVFSGRTPDSGVVSTCNYVARKLGVRSGMPINRAKRLLQNVDAAFLPVDMEYYRGLSERVFAVAERFSDVVEIASIDEAFLDLKAACGGDYGEALQLMRSMKDSIAGEIGLTCSVGVAKNKLLAKMASDDSKPNGLKVIWPGTEKDYLAPKPVDEIPYVGKKTAERLRSIGVSTVGELARVEPSTLVGLFGYRVGHFLHLASRGELDEPVIRRGEAKQISRIITLKSATRDIDEILQQLRRVVNDLHARIISKGVFFEGVSVIGITKDMQTVSRSVLMPRASQSVEDLSEAASQCLRELLDQLNVELRRVGVKVYKLSGAKGQSRLTQF
jgi:DNA polymerase IV (DinB-like DNA polymerase)